MLRNYFKPKVRKNVPTTAAAAGSMTAGKIECSYCYGWYFSMRQRLLFGWHSKGLSWTFQSTLVPLTQLLARLQNHRKLSLTR
mmetsp:Transcript_21459/g.43049  ORF Transcript_21459/g.43049 Transcript_21459/m.43049 type:complete len:83 (+) Transcript_21459:144-392(+)